MEYLCTKNLQDFRFVFAAECKLTTFWRQSFKRNFVHLNKQQALFYEVIVLLISKVNFQHIIN